MVSQKHSVPANGLSDKEFFHANYVLFNGSQSFIATQFPNSDKAAICFWEVFHREGALVIDLTNCKDEEKRIDYKPSTTKTFGEIEVEPVEAQPFEDASFHRYRFKMEKNGEESIEQDIIRYKGWEDDNGTKSAKLIELINLARSYASAGKYFIVHCMAGVGRTGTFITMLITVDQILRGEINRENLLDKLKDIIIECRKQRGSNFVRNVAQFKTIVETCEMILSDPTLIKV